MQKIFLHPATILTYVILLHGVNITAIISRWFQNIVWLDEVLHFAGGFWIAMVILYALNTKQFEEFKIIERKKIILIFTVLAFVALVGVMWELWEFSMDQILMAKYGFPANQPSIADTNGDLFMDLLGGLTFALLYKRPGE